ncbi:MAG: alpha/beta fold hydrolase [Dermatophilaceae bacterium]|nr:alpha/beta fold hydrolase [Dermatophilaceae bacterium]
MATASRWRGPGASRRHADDLALLLDAEGLERVTVVGMSMGGFVAMALAERHPQRVESLVGDATDVYFGEPDWARVSQPIRFLRAESGVGRGTPPAYAAADLERFAPATARTVALDGVDHAASIMGPRGATAAAELVRETLA